MGQEPWSYHIEPYRSRITDWAYERASEADANIWFLFGEKGEDKRVFGVFLSRYGAEDAADKLANGRLGERYRGVIKNGLEDDFERALAESANRGKANDNDKEIER